MPRADPVFLSFSVSWISEGPVLSSHQPQQVYAWDTEITAYVGYVVSSLGAFLLCSRGFLRHNCAAFHHKHTGIERVHSFSVILRRQRRPQVVSALCGVHSVSAVWSG